jgi:hypothetical protein
MILSKAPRPEATSAVADDPAAAALSGHIAEPAAGAPTAPAAAVPAPAAADSNSLFDMKDK